MADPEKTPDPQDPNPVVPVDDPQDPGKDPAQSFTPITSQEEFDKTLGRRLAAERAKYAGYEDLKAKAAELDQLKDANKTETQRLSDQLTQFQKENDALKLTQLRAEVAAEKGIPAKIARRLTGTTREELEADADELLETLPKPETVVPLNQRPRERLRGGGRPDEEPEETDPRKLAAKIPR
jgi:hypothetical protein